MIKDKKFIIEFPFLIESPADMLVASGCTTNTNYYMTGTGMIKTTCCCDCDKTPPPGQ